MGKHLNTYLSDHAAGSVAMIELAKRSAENNRGSELGDYLSGIVPKLEAEHRALERFIEKMNASDSALKNMAAWASEKLGRLKLNDAILRYSELSRIVELEGLIAACEIKIIMWRILKAHTAENPAFSNADTDRFISDHRSLKESLEGYHGAAARIAFSE